MIFILTRGSQVVAKVRRLGTASVSRYVAAGELM